MKSKLTTTLLLAGLLSLAAIPAAGAADIRNDRIEANATDNWTLTLHSGRENVIHVIGDGDTDLDAWLYDENGNQVDLDTDGTDHCILVCRPRWTGTFRLVIRNYGDVYNRYVLRVN